MAGLQAKQRATALELAVRYSCFQRGLAMLPTSASSCHCAEKLSVRKTTAIVRVRSTAFWPGHGPHAFAPCEDAVDACVRLHAQGWEEGCTQVTLQYLAEPMRQLPLALVEEACTGMHLEQYDQHNVVYAANDEPSHYYVCLAGASYFAALPLLPGSALVGNTVCPAGAHDLW